MKSWIGKELVASEHEINAVTAIVAFMLHRKQVSEQSAIALRTVSEKAFLGIRAGAVLEIYRRDPGASDPLAVEMAKDASYVWLRDVGRYLLDPVAFGVLRHAVDAMSLISPDAHLPQAQWRSHHLAADWCLCDDCLTRAIAGDYRVADFRLTDIERKRLFVPLMTRPGQGEAA